MREDLRLKQVLSPKEREKAIGLLRDVDITMENIAIRLGVTDRVIRDLNREERIRIFQSNGQKGNPS